MSGIDPSCLPGRYQDQISGQLYGTKRAVPANPSHAKGKYPPKTCEGTSLHPDLPPCQKEWRFHPKRRWRFDYAWPAKKVALEVEGGVWTGGRHTRGKGFLGDVEKYNSATVLGWRVLRCIPNNLKSQNTIELLKTLLT